MGMPQPWVLSLLLVLLPQTWGAETYPPLLYHLTAVSNPSKGVPSFWATGWLGPQQYLSYSSLRREAEPCGAWMWENQVSWYWEKETVDLKSKEQLFLEAIRTLEDQIDVLKGNYTLQGLLGCELAPDNSSLPTAVFALNGEGFMEFNPSTGNWTGEWPETEIVGNLWMKQPEVARKESEFLLTSCPERLLGHLERGLQYLEWKEPPSMRLKASPSDSGSSILTCAAFSFYPPKLKLRFLRNGLAAGSGNSSIGPNGDGSFHAWSLLEVKRGDEHHYQCQVEHEGLLRPLTVDLDSPARSSVPVVGIILGFLVIIVAAAGGVLLWNRMRSGLPAPWLSLSGDDSGDLLPGGNLPPEADPHGANAFPATS
ncbi:IgG receptor FcRn large subunit p51 [Onychomys torridus]|uniref:IgG receptor FcRn large subunit p51 n=1 Tax=Onychomys torridus TaxID=38674 RepID=UPI00167FA07A|nr:IgG receptor FcRn large subunit p51 [Onychomys torridus]XP_036047146.1 IgG receptor FcRn large subunit p51 [Onychomys torridus]XP_036047156.1 IgG receptor FcRn large subunit p51 [Onychomys torridus]XP_036047165.1 IgG receptor FcRn large subunit p51 [Onychomys torridus]XP_036047173.1 IgG receptor FcRn large subunit p51 [Onychomys torridus]XP_036047181.1 IgG receptor FcRn large subunit p51 [Onychomys torridus]XP_036047190.1 IgG receptor FcRn large subunit p51 [Onychomys torridus]